MSDPKDKQKPIARSLCGWCGSGFHKRCAERDGFILFGAGVHHGNQCKCHDAGHEYVIERGVRPEGSKAKRKSGR